MYKIDKHGFGAFIAALRKEKGYTQKDLAAKLFISDKAVSKWETGISIPDVALLIPLAEILDVTVTELLKCQRLEKEVSMDCVQVEDLVKTVISYPEDVSQKNALSINRISSGSACSAALPVLKWHLWFTAVIRPLSSANACKSFWYSVPCLACTLCCLPKSGSPATMTKTKSVLFLTAHSA